MRAAQIDDNSIVINFVEVNGFDAEFLDPMNAQFGSFWDGTTFSNPPPQPPSTTETAALVTQSFNSSLRRKAEVLQQQGNTFEAVQLLLQAQGVQT